LNSTALIWLGLGALAMASFAATAVQAFRDFSRAQLRELLRNRNLLARYDEISQYHRQAASGAESLRVFASAGAVVAAAAFLWNTQAENSSWLAGLALTASEIIGGAVILWLAIVWLPSVLARLWAEPLIARTWSVWRSAGKLLAPSAAGTDFVERAVHRMSGKEQTAHSEQELEEEIREVVTEGQREGLIEEDAREMIESVMGLGEVVVSEIMTPRTDMVSIPINLDWDEALRQVIASGHTRLPVYGESRDEVVGVLHIKDILQEMGRAQKSGHRPIADLLRRPFFVPESKPVDTMLQEFQRGRTHIAIVVDEFGGVSGLVTIEDVLEEIVGEIADEHDDVAGEGIKSIDEHTSEALAGVHISEVNERLGLHLPDDEHFDTIGGFVFHQLGRIPRVGEEITYDGVKIKVLEAARRRIHRVAIEVLTPEETISEESAKAMAEKAEG
jgi:CBS domain containing-hemolysin-like protein